MPEVTSGEPPKETESQVQWRKIKRALVTMAAKLAIYGAVLFMAASQIMTKGG